MPKGTKSKQSVTPEGRSVKPLIDGVLMHQPITQQDDRGTLCEIYNPNWQFDHTPLVYAYQVTVRPGKVKGWAVHTNQVDRYFFAAGSLKLVLFDDRPDSPTRGMINELYFSEVNRALVSVPAGIYHAVENVGAVDGVMFNLPSEPYHHEDPDKHTLPLENDFIPYSFAPRRGG